MQSKRFILCFGQNKDGELGLGSQKEGFGDIRSIQIQDEQFNSAQSVSSGSHHSALVTKTGEVYVSGSSLHGKLGISELRVTNLSRFTRIPNLKPFIIQVACGDYHTLALAKDGVVYSWGGSLHKKAQGGSDPQPVEQLIQMQARIIQVDCGDFHSIALDQMGRVFSWGGGGQSYNKGQLGQGHLGNVEQPQQITDLAAHRVTQISAGGYHTLAVTDEHLLFSWGSGQYGECGNASQSNVLKPTQLKLPADKESFGGTDGARERQHPLSSQANIKQIRAGGHHSMILTANGKLYTFGFGQHGQLGHRSSQNLYSPRLVKDLLAKPVIMIAAGWNHSLVLTEAGDLYSCGYAQYGQLGLGSNHEVKSQFQHVAQLGPRKIYKIFAGGNHSWVVLDDIIPVREKFRVPSPLPERPGSLSHSPSSIKRDKSRGNSTDKLAFEKSGQQSKA